MTDPSLRPARYGPPSVALPDEGWQYIVDVFEDKFPGSLLSLQIRLSEGVAWTGVQVASEDAAQFILSLVRRHPGVRSVVENIEISAPFRSADRDHFDTAFETLAAELKTSSEGTIANAGDETVSLQRYPHVEIKGEVAVDEEVVVVIYLEMDPDEFTEADPSIIENVPADWKTLSLDVVVSSDQLIFDDEVETATVTLRNGKKSAPAMVHARVSDTAANSGAVAINVQFFYNTRRCGWANRTFPLARIGKSEPIRISGTTSDKPGVSGESFTSPARIDTSLAGSDFVITISRDRADPEGDYSWTTYSYRAGGVRRQTHGKISLGTSSSAYAENLLSLCPAMAPGKHARQMKAIGEQIWNLTPATFRDHYISLLQQFGNGFPIQLFSDEPYVPWEMMCPVIKNDGMEHLFLSHPVARWLTTNPMQATPAFADGMMASFVPSYKNRELPAARTEAEWLRDNVGAVLQEPTAEAFLELLETPPQNRVSIIHFAGHGKCGSDNAPSAIELTNSALVTELDVSQTGVKLGRRDNSLFVLNACEVGSGTRQLGMSSGWASALTKNGFGAVVAPLWAVRDQHASDLIVGTLDRFLREGMTLAEAVRQSRRAGCEKSATPFAYVLYGDVMSRASSP